MPKQVYYSDVKVIKKPIKKRLKSFFNFFILAAIFVLIIFVSIGFSNALTIGNVGAYLVYGDRDIIIKPSSLFVVTMGEYELKSEAEQVALGSSIQGASGYLWFENNKYYVVGSVYPTLAEANAVIDNLKNTNYLLDVLEIHFPKVNLYMNNYDNKQVKSIKESLAFIDNLYLKIYEYSISYDKGEINNFAISSNLSDFRGECKVNISALQFISQGNHDVVTTIQNTLIIVDGLLDELVIKTIDNSTTNYSLKNTLAKVVRLKYDLYRELSLL